MATYLSVLLLFVWVSTSSSNPRSCGGRCGEGYYRGSFCQCDYDCLGLNECCADFQDLCTSKDSCKGRCGEPFNRGNPCHCDIDCVSYNQCCPDYESMCLIEDSALKPRNTASAAQRIANLCLNIKNKKSTESSNEEMTNLEGTGDEFTVPEYETEPTPSEGRDVPAEILPEGPYTGSDIEEKQKENSTFHPENETSSPAPSTPTADVSSIFPADENHIDFTTQQPSEELTASSTLQPQENSSIALTEGPTSVTPVDDSPEEDPKKQTITVDPTSPVPAEDPTSPGLAEDPTSPGPAEDPISPVPAEDPTSPGPAEDPISPVPAEDPTSPVPAEDPISPVPAEDPTSPVPAEDPTSTVAPEDPNNQTPAENPTSPAATADPTDQNPAEDPRNPAPAEDSRKPAPTEDPTSMAPTEGSTSAAPTENLTTAPTEGATPVPRKTPAPMKPTKKPTQPSKENIDKSEVKESPKDPVVISPIRVTEKPLKPSSDLNGRTDILDYQSDDYDSNLCSGRPVSGLTTLRNGTIVVFRGHYFWTLDKQRNPDPPQLITQVWGIPSPIDTVYTRCNCQGKTYFFKGKNYWRFENGAMDPGFPKPISEGFGQIGHITAALSIPEYRSRKESVIFFKRGGMAQKYTYQVTPNCGRRPKIPVITVRMRTRRQTAAALGQVINISRTWRGFPTMVTSSVSVPSRVKEGYKYYVFSQRNYYSMKMERDKPVILKPVTGPKENPATSFFKCKDTQKI
ncbi:proteoglycan 4b isoform X2 [Danio rerio]|uniref:Proteoglycan 4b isoform X2 n=1 Tax=Danio rerio TaxID=7955 RepID=A0AC58I2X1_DANRE|nr:proteoglycan 4 isoform X1 [Danio rerio]|eukprot:XP_005160745.1 proteoglycan 4 isoform X1 [Danio rerio]